MLMSDSTFIRDCLLFGGRKYESRLLRRMCIGYGVLGWLSIIMFALTLYGYFYG